MMNLYPEYIKTSQNSKKENNLFFLSEQKIWIDQKDIVLCQISKWNNTQHHLSLKKWKLKLQQGTTMYLFEWLKFKNMSIPSADREVKYPCKSLAVS